MLRDLDTQLSQMFTPVGILRGEGGRTHMLSTPSEIQWMPESNKE